MQRAAGGVLGEVKLKQAEVRGLQRLASGLQELRELRRDSSKRRGERTLLHTTYMYARVYSGACCTHTCIHVYTLELAAHNFLGPVLTYTLELATYHFVWQVHVCTVTVHNNPSPSVPICPGDAPLVAADDQFSSSLSCLLSLLEVQARLYQEEEHALRVLMAEEVAERMAAREGQADKEGVLFVLCCLCSFPCTCDTLVIEVCCLCRRHPELIGQYEQVPY